MIFSSMWRRYAATCLSILGVSLWACAAPDPARSSDSDLTDGEALEIQFPKMYSAFVPGHEAKIPAMVEGVSKVKWTSSDPETADVETESDGSAMITIRKAGTVTIKAKAGSLTGEAPLEITEAQDGEWEAGNARYNNGKVLKRGGGGGGGGRGDGGISPEFQQAACTSCHGTGSGEGRDVEHTPMQTGGYSDEQLTKGEKPAGVEQRLMSKERWQRIHKWTMDEFAVKGLVIYLRTLEPKTQGVVDFGGRGKGGGGGDRDGGRREGGTR
jgi:hypothetical protein